MGKNSRQMVLFSPGTGKTKTDLEIARQEVEDGKDEGVTCRCCGQFCKLYRRKLNSNMAAFLCRLVVRFDGETPIHHSEIRDSKQGRDYPHLAAWGLMFDSPSPDGKKRRSGWWTPTSKGIDFAHRRIRVPQYALVFDGKVEGYGGEDIGVVDALGDRFDYREMMGGV